MRFLRPLAALALGLAVAAPAAGQTPAAGPGPAPVAATKVTFLLTSDIYLMNEQAMPDGRRRGGFARLATVVKAERAKGGHVLLAHAGDTLSPSLMSGFDRGAHIVALTNLVPPDIFVPGNHEFDFGRAIFLQRMAEAKFPLYAANLRAPDGQPIPGFKDRGIVTFDGVRIGLTGAAYDDTTRTSTAEGLQFGPTVATARTQAETLRREGADFTVAVVHADRKQDIDIAATRAVDLVLSGHDHDLYVNYDEQTAVVESSYDAHYVTAIDVAIEVTERAGKRVTRWWPQFRIIDTATVEPDPAVAAVVAAYEAEFSREMDVPLGTTAVELDSRNATVRTREAAIGNLFADAMRIANATDIAVTNGGGIRANKVYAPGSSISRRDVLAELPFNNKVVTVEMTGASLRRALENGFAVLPDAGGRFPQVSGLVMEVDAGRPAGRRIVAIRTSDAAFSDTRVYRVAINDFLARGGDGYVDFRDAKRITPDYDAPLFANAVMAFIRRAGTVQSKVEGRIVLK